MQQTASYSTALASSTIIGRRMVQVAVAPPLSSDIAAHHLTEAFTVSSVMAGSMGSHQPWAHSERSGIRVQSKLTSNTFAAPSNVISPRVKFAPPA
jgi:hypothetical protein